MSLKVSSWVWDHSLAKNGARLVLLAIADFADDAGRAFPAVETIAAKCRLSERAVHEAIKALIALGDLVVGMREGPNFCNVYRVQILRGADSSGCRKQQEGVQILHDGGADSSERGCRICTQTVIEPSINRHKEPPYISDVVVVASESGSDAGKPPKPSHMTGFDDFWKAYPKKKSKGDAEKAWKQMSASKLTETIISALTTAKTSHDWTKDGGKYIPHPATWLRRRGWEDEHEPQQPTRQTSTRYKKPVEDLSAEYGF